ncbi:MAG TPA: DNA repair protein RecN [Anaerolineaceae bacterium]|nr:DNA repair protein RecN [Anaerolineaceae bacterium]
MLSELRIENFAIIQSLELDFRSGLTTFTGETGAGKSIILDAIEALVGGRTDPTLIRSGAERAMVEATFQLSTNSAPVVEILQREELLDDAHTLTLSRELRREGRNVARVNGRSVGISLLRELGGFLVDIHGQSEHLSLLNVRHHIDLLDRYAQDENERSAYQAAYQQLLALRRELAELRQEEQEASRRTDLLNFQIQEIEGAQLKADEEEDLRHERDRLANAESLAALAQQSLVLLDEGSPEAPAISDLLGEVSHAMTNLSRIDASRADLGQTASTLQEMARDLGQSLRDYLEGIEYNPRRLEQVEERLDVIHRLKRKYGLTIEAILAFGKDAREKLERITHAGERIAELEADQHTLLEKLAGLAAALSARRKAAALELGRMVEVELGDLQMPGARFAVDAQIQPDPQGLRLPDGQQAAFDAHGVDKVEFLIAPNPGEGFKPMVKIASGGETARLMLALKNVLTQADTIPTLIFDEIDQGIGGRTGMVVGEKLWQLARHHQVLCVTHLPQLAAFGDQQVRVSKQVEEGRTLTRVDRLDEKARLDELAQMLGMLSEANRASAQETLGLARQRAAQLIKK